MSVVESRIERVKVYHQGATVWRRVTLAPQPGATREITIVGLPLALDDGSARVRPLGESVAQITTSDLRVGVWVRPSEEVVKAPEDAEIERVEREIARRHARQAQLDAERALLEQMQVPDRPAARPGTPPPASPLAARLALDAFTSAEADARLAERQRLDAALRALGEELTTLHDRKRRASTAAQAGAEDLSKQVTATLQIEGEQHGPLELELEYFIPGARWAPQYQCHVDQHRDTARIQLRAVVAQRSGEDWSGVRLELSTASPARFSQLPKLASVRIGEAQDAPATPVGFRQPPRGAASLFGDYDRDRARVHEHTLRRYFSFSVTESLHIQQVLSVSAGEVRQAIGARAEAQAVTLGMISDEVALRDYEEFDEEDDYGATSALESPMFAEELDMLMARSAAPAPPPPSQGFGGPPGAPMPAKAAAAPAPQMARKRARSEERERAITIGDRADDADGFLGGTPARPAFQHLSLPAPTHGDRNKLMPADLRARYTRSVQAQGRVLTCDVMAEVLGAQQRAQGVASLSLPSGASDVRAASGYFDYAYAAEDRVTIPSDGTFHSVPLGVREAPCALQYVVVPREDTNVYRVALITNPTAAPMLPGSVEVYVGGEYVLTSRLTTVSPNAQFRLGLGVEQAIKCARNITFSQARSGAEVVATSMLSHTIEVELVNNLRAPITCEIRERIPQPGPDAEVVVEEGRVSPAWEAYTQQERGHKLVGGRRWTVRVAPGESAALVAEYVVKIYAKNELVGGNRRER